MFTKKAISEGHRKGTRIGAGSQAFAQLGYPNVDRPAIDNIGHGSGFLISSGFGHFIILHSGNSMRDGKFVFHISV